MKHTPGPWEICRARYIEDGSIIHITQKGIRGEICAIHEHMDPVEDEANAQRIVDCVNACEGINPKAVKNLLRVCKGTYKALREICETVGQVSVYNRIMAEHYELEQAIAKATPNP